MIVPCSDVYSPAYFDPHIYTLYLTFPFVPVFTHCFRQFSFLKVERRVEGGFQLFNQFAVFIYSQLQIVLPDSVLGSITDWDSYLIIDLDRADLPYKSPSEFILNENFHKLVLASKLPRPGKFVDQSIAFCKAFCKLLLGHEIIKSDLIRGL